MTRTTIPSTAFSSPIAVPDTTSTPSTVLTTTLFVTNLHCAFCVSHARETISPLQGIFKVDVNCVSHTVCVQHSPGLTSKIADLLVDAAFEVSHVTTSDQSGRVISTHDVPSKHASLSQRSLLPLFMTRAQMKHIANCQACQTARSQTSLMSRIWLRITGKREREGSTDEASQAESGLTTDGANGVRERRNLQDPDAERHVAVFSIEGMTCAACPKKIAAKLQRLSGIEKVRIDLASKLASVRYRGLASDVEWIARTIDELGFKTILQHPDEGLPADVPAGSYKAVVSIEGMTCGSCVASVTRGLEEIGGVSSVNVDLLGNCATVKLSQSTLVDKVLESIEDLGFDGTLIKLQPDNTSERNMASSRTVEFEIFGMYCPACPGNILKNVQMVFGDHVLVMNKPTLKSPRITVRYEPIPPHLNVRRLKAAIETADPLIKAQVYHPPTMEERSVAVRRRESGRILRHLLFTLVAAIPSFIIGVVFMSLVPSNNSTRVWFEKPLWAGGAMRIDWAMFFVTTPVMFYGANLFHTRALSEIWSLWRPQSKVPILRRFYRFGSMNLLISAGTSVAYFASLAILIMAATTPRMTDGTHSGLTKRHSITYFDTVTFLTLFILCGKYLQAYSKAKTGDAVAMLGNLRPKEALVVDNANEKFERSIPIELLDVGDVVSIPHGASPPSDGIVDQEGTFLFDESSLTGESRPVKKVRGDTILTGSVNISDPVRVVIQELGGASMLDQIIAVVRNGQARRAPIERFADLATSYFTPIITLIAVLTWTIWLALGQSGRLPHDWLDVDQGGWPFWSVEFAIAVFVVACPCGLGLAAPTALFVGGGLAAKAGVLVQGGGEAFQEASQLDIIVFDKTGTLTKGQMRVTDMQMLEQDETEEKKRIVLALAKTMEDSSMHPIAKAIADFCSENAAGGKCLDVKPLEIQEVSGQGMRGIFDVRDGASSWGRFEASIGSERQLQSSKDTCGDNVYLSSTSNNFQSLGCSIAIFSMRQLLDFSADQNPHRLTPIAVFAITDPIRVEAPEVLRELRTLGLDVHMCTGDNETTARAIASQLDFPISHVRAGVMPQEKAAYIEELQQKNNGRKRKLVAFVGDGTNDTPALTAADVSIALATGSDIAMTSSSFILLNANLTIILHLIRLAKRVFLRVKLNFAWAAVYNICLIPVAAGVFFPVAQWRLSPVWAAAAMALSSLSVVLSSLALRLPEVTWSGKKRQ